MSKENLYNQGYREGLFIKALSTGIQEAFDEGYHYGVIDSFNREINKIITIEDQIQSCSQEISLCRK